MAAMINKIRVLAGEDTTFASASQAKIPPANQQDVTEKQFVVTIGVTFAVKSKRPLRTAVPSKAFSKHCPPPCYPRQSTSHRIFSLRKCSGIIRRRSSRQLSLPVPVQRLQGLLLPRLATLRRCLESLQQSLQILTERREREAGEIRRRHLQFDQRILEMFDRAVANAPADLMVRGGRLNQTLHEEAPGFRVALPDLLPGFVRFPILAGVE